MSETSAAVPRDRLADMTRARDAWRRSATAWMLSCFLNMATWMLPHIERAWLAWRAESDFTCSSDSELGRIRDIGGRRYACVRSVAGFEWNIVRHGRSTP